jgi:hypothetical protein
MPPNSIMDVTPRKRPMDRPEVQRPILKYIIFSGGPIDKQVCRIPVDHDAISSSDGATTYRDSGETLDGYPRFDLQTIEPTCPASSAN